MEAIATLYNDDDNHHPLRSADSKNLFESLHRQCADENAKHFFTFFSLSGASRPNNMPQT
jgi:hypothetical protein